MKYLTIEEQDKKYKSDMSKFLDGLEKLSKECGIAIEAYQCVKFYSTNGIKEIKYKRVFNDDIEIELLKNAESEIIIKEQK